MDIVQALFITKVCSISRGDPVTDNWYLFSLEQAKRFDQTEILCDFRDYQTYLIERVPLTLGQFFDSLELLTESKEMKLFKT